MTKMTTTKMTMAKTMMMRRTRTEKSKRTETSIHDGNQEFKEKKIFVHTIK